MNFNLIRLLELGLQARYGLTMAQVALLGVVLDTHRDQPPALRSIPAWAEITNPITGPERLQLAQQIEVVGAFMAFAGGSGTGPISSLEDSKFVLAQMAKQEPQYASVVEQVRMVLALEVLPQLVVGECLATESKLEKLTGGTWLVNGKYPQGDSVIDLDGEVDPKQPLTPAATVARLIRATVNTETGQIKGDMLEKVAQVLGDMLEKTARAADQALQNQRPAERSLWPEEPSHWIFAKNDKDLPPLVEAPKSREEESTMRLRARDIAMGAVRAASGYGSSRVFNIEGFVENVVRNSVAPFVEPPAKGPAAPRRKAT